MRDKRRYPRVHVQLDADVTGCSDRVKVADLSIGGCQLLSTPGSLSKGARVHLHISLPSQPGAIAVTGRVCWRESHRAGLEFEELVPTHGVAIGNFVTRTILAAARMRQVQWQ